MVRLKREVKRLELPIPEVGWLMPVAAQHRWGDLKALAAEAAKLQASIHDAEVRLPLGWAGRVWLAGWWGQEGGLVG